MEHTDVNPLLWVIMATLYFWPALAAYTRKHVNTHAIFVLNLLLGWTFVGWVAALVWAVSKPATVVIQVPTGPVLPPTLSNPNLKVETPVGPVTLHNPNLKR